MTPREIEKLHARILWLEKRLTEREELISSLLDDAARLRRVLLKEELDAYKENQ